MANPQEVWIKRIDDDLNFTQYVEWNSIRLEDNLTSQANTLKFKVKKYGSITFTPEINDEIELYDYNDKIFAGHIIKIRKYTDAKKIVVFEIEAKDYTHEMDGKLVSDSYEDQLVEDIIDSIVSTYLPAGYTTTNVSATGITLEYISFNYEYPSKCLQQLAELIGYDWYVDYNKDIHFFEKNVGEIAPFSITDSGEELWQDLEIIEDQKQIKNIIYVRGGEYVGDLRTDKVGEGDGATKVFKLPYRYDSTPTVEVNSVAQTVGIDFIDSFDSYDCLWNYQEKVIRFDTAPTAGHDIEVTGQPLIPVLVKAKSGASTSVYGDREYKIIDKDIKTKELARQRAEGEILDYSESIKEGSFTTYESGLTSGMRITVNSSDYGVNRDYIITRVVMKMLNPREPYYNVIITSARTMGIIDYLQKMLRDIDKKVGPIKQEDEVIDVILDLEEIDTLDNEETLTFNHYTKDLQNIDELKTVGSLLRVIKDSPPTWVVGTYGPISDADRKRPIFLNRDCQLGS